MEHNQNISRNPSVLRNAFEVVLSAFGQSNQDLINARRGAELGRQGHKQVDELIARIDTIAPVVQVDQVKTEPHTQ